MTDRLLSGWGKVPDQTPAYEIIVTKQDGVNVYTLYSIVTTNFVSKVRNFICQKHSFEECEAVIGMLK